ncbi:LLM class flavin-dependent oxidoreductase [Mycolicibacterium baixiangningiae]|uniref:LLM class flavin-dependent oxidoreductase n=1 Tax=Mycolicibacterium baixiangningiae TaxID=2761578 RepID=UPI0018D0E75F|nr:LLM class flavin-dependent oxidoreductase [Mycolicibacterium baixiangningiae]
MTTIHLGFPSHSVADVHMREWGAVAISAEAAGFDTLWHSNERFFREMFVRMTVSATVTERIMLGGAVSDGFSSHPAIVAQSLATVAELAGGRTTLAIGAGGSGLPMMGITRSAVTETVHATYTSIAELLAGERVTRIAPSFTMRNAHLRVTPPQPVPLWIASRGPRMLTMAGGIADGVMVASQAAPPGLQRAIGRVHAGAEALERDPREVRTMARVDTCVHPDPAAARDGCRLMVAKMLWMSYPDRGFVTDAGLTVPDDLERIIATRDYDALDAVADLVPDAMIDAFCWAGSPEQLVDRVAEAVSVRGVTDVGFWLLRAPGQTRAEAQSLLGQTLPAIRARLHRSAVAP